MNPSEGLRRIASVIRWIGRAAAALLVIGGAIGAGSGLYAEYFEWRADRGLWLAETPYGKYIFPNRDRAESFTQAMKAKPPWDQYGHADATAALDGGRPAHYGAGRSSGEFWSDELKKSGTIFLACVASGVLLWGLSVGIAWIIDGFAQPRQQ